MKYVIQIYIPLKHNIEQIVNEIGQVTGYMTEYYGYGLDTFDAQITVNDEQTAYQLKQVLTSILSKYGGRVFIFKAD
jgi:CTP:phosphocholine cytidylyltransferase-like protein